MGMFLPCVAFSSPICASVRLRPKCQVVQFYSAASVLVTLSATTLLRSPCKGRFGCRLVVPQPVFCECCPFRPIRYDSRALTAERKMPLQLRSPSGQDTSFEVRNACARALIVSICPDVDSSDYIRVLWRWGHVVRRKVMRAPAGRRRSRQAGSQRRPPPCQRTRRTAPCPNPCCSCPARCHLEVRSRL